MLRRAALASAFVALVAHGCEGDHDALKKPASPGTGGGAGTEAGPPEASPDVELDVAPDLFVEPPGQSVLTLLHGVVDASRLAFCFARVVDGSPQAPLGQPLPPGGLPWGNAITITELAGLEWAKDDVLPIVIAGDFSLLGGKTCAEAVALAASLATDGLDAGADGAATDAPPGDGPEGDAVADVSTEAPPAPKLRAGELPVLPAGTLGSGYSLLLVAAGCLGGPAFTDPAESAVCGAGYTPGAGSLAPVLVPLSRVTKPGAMGLQVVNAARASDAVDVLSKHPKGSSIPPIVVAEEVVFGAVAPRPPLLDYSATAFGVPITASALEVSSHGASSPLHVQTWKDALDAGGLSDVKDGQTFALVLIGPRPNQPGAQWWNGPKLVALPAAP